jgi:Uncharacterized conserved protein
MYTTISQLYISDVYPDKAQYLYKENVNIIVELSNKMQEEINAVIQVSVLDIDKVIMQQNKDITLKPEVNQEVVFSYVPSSDESKGYGVDVILTVNGSTVCSLSTAFDVADSWKKAPRYGFLCDFYRKDENDAEAVKQMSKYHLNVVQFYDWMYRHDNLIPDENYFIDPLNRQLSLNAVKNKLKLCHDYGMKTMAYGAIYAASREFFEKNRDLALYNSNGGVQNLGGNWLFIMNISPESPWVSHIIDEFAKTVTLFDFDGIHMDTYGFPKAAFSMLNGQKRLERLEEHYPSFINRTREQLEAVKDDVGIIFNAVGNWSVETVASAKQDAVYIEVWDPCERYFHLNHIVSRAKELGRKPVILAAYLSAFLKENGVDPEYAENSFLLVSSVIFASGGYHILLGENNGILAHPYFVRYGAIRKEFERMVRNYYDFIVRYQSLLYDLELSDKSMTHANGINEEYVFGKSVFSSYGEPDKVWTIIKEKPGFKVINLINLKGIASDIWNEEKTNRPVTVENIQIKVLVNENVKKVVIATPDFNNGSAKELDFTYSEHVRGRLLEFTVPILEIWNLVCIETEPN